MKRLGILILVLMMWVGVASAVPSMCSITGTVYRPDGTGCANCSITFAPTGIIPQIVSGTPIYPTTVYTTTDGSGVMTAISLIRGAAMTVTITDANGFVSGPIQTQVAANSGETIQQLLTNNQLTAGATTVGGLNVGTKTITFADSPYTVVDTDFMIDCDASAGAVVINLPASSGGGRWLNFKKTDSSINTCTITRAGADNIDGATTWALRTQYAGALINDTELTLWRVTAYVYQHPNITTQNITANSSGGPYAIDNYNVAGVLNVKAYGAVSSTKFVTATTSAGSTGITYATKEDFKPGQTVELYHVGAAATGTAPAATVNYFTFGTAGTNIETPAGIQVLPNSGAITRSGCTRNSDSPPDLGNSNCTIPSTWMICSVDAGFGIKCGAATTTAAIGPQINSATERTQVTWTGSVNDVNGYMVYGCNGVGCTMTLKAVLPLMWYSTVPNFGSPGAYCTFSCAVPGTQEFTYMGHSFGNEYALGTAVPSAAAAGCDAVGCNRNLFTTLSTVGATSATLADAATVAGTVSMMHENSAAFTAAVAASQALSGLTLATTEVFCPQGDYQVGQTISMLYARGMRFAGPSYGAIGSGGISGGGCAIDWLNAGGTVFNMHETRDVTVDHIVVTDKTPNLTDASLGTPGAVFDWDYNAAIHTVTNTHVSWEHNLIQGGGVPFLLGLRGGGNSEDATWIDNGINDSIGNGGSYWDVYMAAAGQTNGEYFRQNRLSNANVGFMLNTIGGVYALRNNYSRVAIPWYMAAAPFGDGVASIGETAQATGQFIYNNVGDLVSTTFTVDGAQIHLSATSIDANQWFHMPGNGCVIEYNGLGLRLLHDSFVAGNTPNADATGAGVVPGVQQKICYQGDNGAHLYSEGNRYATDPNPFWPNPTQVDYHQSVGDIGVQTGSNYGHLHGVYSTTSELPKIVSNVDVAELPAPTVSIPAGGGAGTCTYNVVGLTEPDVVTGLPAQTAATTAVGATCTIPPTTGTPVTINVTAQPGVKGFAILTNTARTSTTATSIGFLPCPWAGRGTTCPFKDNGAVTPYPFAYTGPNTGNLTVGNNFYVLGVATIPPLQVATTTALPSYRNTIMGDGAGGYWRLGEAAGNFADTAAGPVCTAHATITYGETGAILDDPNNAILLNGTSAYCDAATDAALPSGDVMSMEAWIKLASATIPGPEVIGGQKADGGVFYINTLNQILFARAQAPNIGGQFDRCTTRTITDTTTWHHVAVTKNGANSHIYLDGVPCDDYTGAVNFTLNPADAVEEWGRSQVGSNAYFNGSLDEIAAYKNIELSAQQVLTHYEVGNRLKNGLIDYAQDVGCTFRYVFGDWVAENCGTRTVASLPDCTLVRGAWATITDNNAACGTTGFWVSPTGGAGTVCHVTCDGSNAVTGWKVD